MNAKFRVVTTVVAPASLALLFLPSCARVKVDPIEVKPIHIVHDINIRVDRQLDEFFAYQEKMGAATQPAVTASNTTQPATAQTAGTAPATQGVTP